MLSSSCCSGTRNPFVTTDQSIRRKQMRKASKALSLAALASAVAGVVGYNHGAQGATITWLGTIADPNSSTYTVSPSVPGIFTDGQPLYLWNTSTLNFSSGGNPVAYSVGDDVVFAAGDGSLAIRMTSSNLNPSSMTFIGGTSTTHYYFLRSGDFLDSGGNSVSSNTPFGTNHNTVLTLDTGFQGTVHIRPRAGAGLAEGISNTIIRSGTLELNDALPLPNLNNNNRPNVTLDGGTLAININTAGNTQPASTNLAGVITVLSDSALVLNRSAVSESGGAIAESRTWNGTITMGSGVTLNLMRMDAVRLRLGANLAAVTGTFSLLDGPSGLNNHVVLENSAGSVNATWNLGTGTSILETNQSGYQIGKVIGGASTELRGSFAFGGHNTDETIAPKIANREAGTTSISKIGTAATTLTNNNTYTGGTTVNGGTLVLGGASGAIAASGSLTLNAGTLKLDNAAASNGDRLSNGTITLNGGNLEFVGNLSASTSELAGPLVAGASASTVRTVAAGSGGNATITFASLARTNGVVDFDLAPGVNVAFSTAPTLVNGIIGPWATVNGTNWATVSGGTVAAYAHTPGETNSDPSVWAATDNVNLTAGGTSTVAASATVNSLRFGANGTVSIAAGQSLTINSGGILAASDATIGGAGSLTAGNGTAAASLFAAVANAGNTLTISAPIADNGASGTVSLVKVGAGKLVLAGNNTFTGGINIFGGTLAAGTSNIFNPTANLIVDFGTTFDLGGFNQTVGTVSLINGSIINSGGAASLTAGAFDVRNGTISASLAGAGSLSKTTGSNVTLSAVNSYTGGTTVSAGTLTTAVDGALPAGGAGTVSGGALNIGATNQTLGVLTVAGGSVLGTTGTVTASSVELNSGTISAILAGSGGVNKTTTGTGSLLAANTYTGVTNITGGTVAVNNLANGGSPSSLGASSSAASNLSIDNAVLNYVGAGSSTDRLFTAPGGTVTINSNGTGPVSFTNTGALAGGGAATLTLGGSNTGANTFAPVISGGGAVAKAGSGQWILTGNNTYTGLTAINGGTLTVNSIGNGGSPSPIGASAADAANLVINGGALRYAGGGSSTNRLFTVGNSGGTIDASGTGAIQFTNTGAHVASGTAASRTLTLTGTNTGNNTIAGVLADVGAGSLLAVAKSGTGKWVLTGANTYTGGTTVNDGVLVANKFSNGTLTVNGGVAQVSVKGTANSPSGTTRVPALNVGTAGRLDLNNNALVVNNGNLGTITSRIKSALENGGNFDWGGPGIGSTQANVQNTTAGSFLYGLGVIKNDLAQVGGSGPIYTDFAGESGLSTAEVLVKFTYFGDADLSGSIDATDYSLIDNGYVNTLSGWINGDFDYSGVIDATDYALIDNAYVNQAGPLAEALIAQHSQQFGGEYVAALRAVQAGVVPEPATAGVLVLGATAMLGRRRRGRSTR
ncbi:beta strand repeat-containing protein [Fontivita pretiosa]|uniref:beta strand repeat-containing protein n=1 Tax=Fontivita pretiosa TaxID=2989684 RepID=UPI003D163F05